MKKLIDVIEIAENNKDFILLEIIGSTRDCILTGVLNGDEELIRVTKGKNHTLTIYKKNGSHFSYDFGHNGYTLISDSEQRRKRAIVDTIQLELETLLEDTDTEDLPQKKADVESMEVTFKIMNDSCVVKNGAFYKHDKNFMLEIEEKYQDISIVDEYVAPNGCRVKIIKATRKSADK
jgi:hypothetical protein